jgi:DNA replicative helicase MCM subunit Mcm2 (Cdc46/Mcm family)
MPLLAHHSFSAQYDDNQLVRVNGTVTKVSWSNPHVIVFVDAKDDAGKVANWQMELASPNGLMRQGWKLDSVRKGDQVTITGFRARNGSDKASALRILLRANGQMFATSPDYTVRVK